MPSKSSFLSIINPGSGYMISTPGTVSSANVTPTSTIIHFWLSGLPYANRFIFIPISPDPPRGQNNNSSFIFFLIYSNS